MKDLFFEVKDIVVLCFLVLVGDDGKYLCYRGINYLVKGEIVVGVKCLEYVFFLMNGIFERKIFRIIVFQIFVIYYCFYCDLLKLLWCYCNVFQECRKLENI